MIIDKETATLIAAAIAAIVALMNTFLTTWRQSKLEREKWERARQDETEKWERTRSDERQRWELQRQDEAAKTVRAAVAEIARLLASGAQAVAWLTWKAEQTDGIITGNDITAYNETMKTFFPQIVGAHLLLVALDKRADQTINPLVMELYRLDEQVAKAGLLFARSPSDGIRALAACADACSKYFQSLHERLKNILGGPAEVAQK